MIREESTGQTVRVRFAFQPGGIDDVAHWLISLGKDNAIFEPEALRRKVIALAGPTAPHHEHLPKKPDRDRGRILSKVGDRHRSNKVLDP